MKETDEIMQMIKQYGSDFFSKEKKYKIDIGIYLEELAEKQGMTRKDLVRMLNLEESYGRKLFGGQRAPTRKILLQSAFILSLNLTETQRLLEIGRKACLYPRVRRDAAIIYAIDKNMTLEQANAFLEEVGEEPLI
ncbi:hypothetical protein NXH76_05805 [Blautia schinkii]|nr:hypothetical protein [Blautia schinkii]